MRRSIFIGMATFTLVAGLILLLRSLDAPLRSEQDPERIEKLQHAVLTETQPTGRSTDWPQWRGPARDGACHDADFRTDWPSDGPPLLWKASTGPGYSCPSVVAGRVYTLFQEGDDETAICWDAESGKERWRSRLPTPRLDGYPGPRATPTVDRGKVFVVGSRGVVRCLDADSGNEVWKLDLVRVLGARVPHWGIAGSPLIDGDRVFLIPGGAAGNAIAALDRQTGRPLWHTGDDQPGYSSPMLATLADQRQLVCVTGETVIGLTPEGKPCWQYPWKTQHLVNAATPICVGNYVLITSGYGHGCVLLEIVEEGGKMQARLVYSHNRLRCHFSTPVFHEDHVYGFDDAMLVCMALRTGDIRWKERGFGKGSLLIANGHLLVLGEQGNFTVAPASSEGFRPLASFTASRRKCWTMPVLADGRLYIRDEEELRCFDLRKAPPR